LTRVACHETTAAYQQHRQTGCRQSRQSVDLSGWKQTDPIAADEPASKRHGVMSMVQLAETAETRARRGSKRRAKTDRADARWLRTLLAEGRLPWGLDPARTRARLAHPYPSAQDARRRAHRLA
jgi:hypothetical protein